MNQNVGRSVRRTPAKHELMYRSVGREIGASSHMRQISRLLWYDLTAGDGAGLAGQPWSRTCSPGIAAHHATFTTVPLLGTLYEVQPATYDHLLDNLESNLPDLGYRRIDEITWRHHGDLAMLRALNESGHNAPACDIRRTDAVLVANDPNAITDWAMRPSFPQEIASRTEWFRSISTMGCNAHGIKRMLLAERLQWFDLVRRQVAALPPHRDLLLAAIENDASQWAYLMGEPRLWRDRAEKEALKAFQRQDLSLDMAWWRTDPDKFDAILNRLFLTRQERDVA